MEQHKSILLVISNTIIIIMYRYFFTWGTLTMYFVFERASFVGKRQSYIYVSFALGSNEKRCLISTLAGVVICHALELHLC